MARYSYQARSAEKIFIPTVCSLASMDASSASHCTGLRPDKSIRGSGRSSASPRGFESGNSNPSKLTDVFAAMQLTGPSVSLGPVMPIPLATKLSIFEARKEYASNWHPSVPALATRSGAAPRIGIYSPGVGDTLGSFASHWHLFVRR
jgi:hypothetical protein